jgi:hypothetical protein
MAEFKRGEWQPARWWRPENRNRIEVPGTYELLENGAVKATFFESISGRKALFPSREDTWIPVVHGNCFGKAVTLIGAQQIRHRGNLGELCATEYRPWVALEGLLLEEEELSITDAVLTLHDQQAWAQWIAYRPDMSDGDDPFYSKVFRYVEPPDLLATVEGATVAIEDRSSFTAPHSPELKLTSRCHFRIRLEEPLELSKFMEYWVFPLEVLIATATGRVGGVETLKVTNRAWETDLEIPSRLRWLNVRVSSKIRTEKPRSRLDWADLLFTLPDMDWPSHAPIIFDAIPRWAYVVEHWAMLLNPDYRWPVARFVSAVQAVEALDRLLSPDIDDSNGMITEVLAVLKKAGFNNRKRGKIKSALRHMGAPSLEDRLRRRVEVIGPAMQELTSDRTWPSRVARLRNIVSHGLDDAHDLDSTIRAAKVSTDLLLHLLEGTFLRNLTFSPEQTAEILRRRSNFGWRVERVSKGIDFLPTV